MKKSFLLIMLLALCMTACGNSVKGTNSNEEDNRKVLELGVFCSNSEVSRQITKKRLPVISRERKQWKRFVTLYRANCRLI